jgi:hypothetical protein
VKKESDVRDDRRRLTVVRSLAYVQSYVHSPYMYTVLRCPANRWGRPTTMAAADAPYQHLPMELRPPYYTQREEIASTSQRYHCLIFPKAGSSSVAHLRNYPKTNDILPSVAVADAQYEHLPMELWPQYCTKRVATPPASCGYTEIFFLRMVLRRLLTSASALFT